MPNLDANISFNLLKMTGGEGLTIGPVLLGAARPVHILTPSTTVRRLVNMTALAVVDAGGWARRPLRRAGGGGKGTARAPSRRRAIRGCRARAPR